MHQSDRYIPWTYAINEAVEAQHVIDMSEISEALKYRTSFLWEVLKMKEPLHLMNYKPVTAYDLKICRFDNLIVELRTRLTSRTFPKEQKSADEREQARWLKWLKGGSKGVSSQSQAAHTGISVPISK